MSVSSQIPEEFVCIFLPSVDQMLADGLQFVIHLVGFDHVGLEGVAKRVGHRTHDAILQIN